MGDGPTCTNSDLPAPCAHTHTQTHTRLPSYVNTLLTQFELWYTVSCHSLSGSFTLLELTPIPSDVNTFCPPLRLWHPTLGHWGSSLHLSHTHTHNGRKKIAALSFLFLSRSIVILVFICRFKKTICYGYKSFVRYTYCIYFPQSAGCLFFFF